MSAQQLSAFLPFRQFDNASKELAAGFVYFWDSGTSILSAGIYADSTGTETVNPVQLDGAGLATIYGVPQAYKMTITDVDGNQIWEQNPVFPFGADSGSSLSSSFTVVENYSELRNLTQDYLAIVVCGRSTLADGGEGIFYQTTETLADNDGTILKRASSTSYVRGYEGLIDPRWFGVSYGVTSDQLDALNAATAVGPVQIAGKICQVTDRRISGVYSFLPGGGFNSSGTPKLTFSQGSKILQGAVGIFGSGISVVFEQNICDTIYSSWFSSFEQSLCTTHSYKYVFDATISPVGDVSIPANYAVDSQGGALLKFTGHGNLSIKNLVYQGIEQIFSYDNKIAYVGTVDLAGVPALLEWFGGVPGYAFGTDNSIPGKAALFSGSVRLLEGKSYVIPADGATWTTSKDLTIAGVTGAEVLQVNQNVTYQALKQTDCILTGAGTLTGTGIANLRDCGILGVQSRVSASTQDATAAIYVPASLLAMGNGGAAESSSDGITWASISGITESISGPIAAGPIRIAAGQSKIWKSTDGGQTWNSQAIGLSTVFGAWYIKVGSTYYYVVTGAGGIAYSTDGTVWNLQTITGAGNIIGLAYHASTSRVVLVGGLSTGFAGIWDSPNLADWTNRPLPTLPTGQLRTVVSGPGGVLVAGGTFVGTILTSSTAMSWAPLGLSGSDTIYASAASDKTFLLAGSTGAIYTSTTNGNTWARLGVGSVAILAATWNSGTFFLGGQSGNIWTSTTDAVSWTSGYVGTTNNVGAVLLTAPVYAIGGKAGSLQVSTDTGAVNWSSVTVPGLSTSDITNMRAIGGVVYILAKGGKLYSTVDFQTFRSITTSTTADLYDIVYNSTAASWTVTGAAGYISTSANLTSAAPTWTGHSVASSEALIRAVWDGTRYTFASVNQIWQTTDMSIAATQTNLALLRGMIINGTTRVMYGDSGKIIYSTDSGVTWTAITVFTSNNFTAGYFGNSVYLLGTSAGTIYRSTDGITWTLATASGLSGSVTAFHWNSTESAFGVVTGSHNMYKSPTGATWSNGIGTVKDYNGDTVTLTFNFYDIWDISGEWQVCGSSGFWMYCASGSNAWHRATNASHQYISADLRAGFGTNAIGSTSAAVWITGHTLVYDSIEGTNNANMIDYESMSTTQGVALDDTGKVWLISITSNSAIGSTTSLSSSTATNLAYDGTAILYATGASSVWTTTKALGFERWSKKYVSPTGIMDMDHSGSNLRISGASGLYVSSPNGLIWTFIGDEFWTGPIPSIAYWNYGQKSIDYSVTTFAQGAEVVLAGASGTIYSGTSAFTPVITALKFNIEASTANVDLVSSEGGTISGPSALRSISYAGLVMDTSFSRMHGTFDSNVARCEIVADGTLSCGDIVIETGSITKTDNLDSNQSPTFALSGSRLILQTVKLNTNGPLNASPAGANKEIFLNSCNGDFSISTNGIAKLYLNNSDIPKDSSVYSRDGYIVSASDSGSGEIVSPVTDGLLPLDAADGNIVPGYVIPQADLSWNNLPTGSTYVDRILTLGGDKYLGAWDGVNSIVITEGQPGLDSIYKFGGRITFEVTIPSDIDNKMSLSCIFVARDDTGVLGATAKNRTWLCVDSEVKFATGIRKAFVHANVWSGANGDPTTECRTILYSKTGGILPVGTTIRAVAWAMLPKNRETYDRFWPANSEQTWWEYNPMYAFTRIDENFGLEYSIQQNPANALRTTRLLGGPSPAYSGS